MRLLTRDKSFYKTLVALSIPVILQGLITFSVTMADNLMVSSLGDVAVSGVYMGNQLQTLLQMLTGGIGGAILILSAQYWGKNDTDSIRKIISIGVHFSLIAGGVLTLAGLFFPVQILSLFTKDPAIIASGAVYLRIVCLSYTFFCLTQALISAMRSVEVTRIGMTVSLISLVVNIGLNYVLIFGKLGFPAMGVAGAALATVISRVTETAVMVIYVLLYDRKLCMKPGDFLKSSRLLRKDFIRYGIPLVAGQIVWSVNMMTNSAILGRLPDSSAVVTAASIANTLNSLVYIAMTSLATALGIITGKTVGAGKTELMKEYSRTVQILFLALGFVNSLVIVLIRSPFISLYRDVSPEATAYARQFINVLAVTIIGSSYQMPCLYGLVKSGGDISFVFRNDTIFVFLVVLPSAILAAWLGAPAWAVFACLKCDQILKCFVAVVKINRYNWMKNLTRDTAETA